MSTLRGRLYAALGVCLLGFSLVLWFAGNRLLDALARDLVAAQLDDAAAALLAVLEIDAQGRPVLGGTAPEYDTPFSGHYFVVRAGGREFVSRSLWDESLAYAPPTVGRVVFAQRSGPQGQPLLVRSAAYVKQDSQVEIAVAADLGPVATYRQRLAALMLAVTAALIVALALAQHLVLRVSLRPLGRVRAALQALENGSAARLDEQVPGEILPLVREVNRLLATLTRRLAHSRHALGDLAHALKTPLQILGDDLAELPADNEHVRDARERTARIGALVERELRRARLAGAGVNAARFRFDEDLDDLCATMRQLHRDREIEIRRCGPLAAYGDREDLHELLGNLLDNACKWATRRVRVEIASGTALRIVVADDGPGIADESLDLALARGARLDETRAGHGLGLGIVADIVAAYAGRLDFARDAALGGLAVSVELPLDGDGNT
ncbi:MAG: sensor histidine kinase [Gammaproteobacteria bacterium]